MLLQSQKIAVKLRMCDAGPSSVEYRILTLTGTPFILFDSRKSRVDDYLTETQVETLCKDRNATVIIIGSGKP